MEENNKQKNILIIIGLFILLTVYYNSVFKPNSLLIKQKKASLAAMKENLFSSEQKVNSLENIRNSCVTYAEKIRLIKEVIPTEPSQFEKKVVEFAEFCALKVNSMNPVVENSSKDLSVKALNLSLKGAFQNLYSFLSKLENTYKTAYISNLNISQGNDDELNFSCTVSFAYLNNSGVEK